MSVHCFEKRDRKISSRLFHLFRVDNNNSAIDSISYK